MGRKITPQEAIRLANETMRRAEEGRAMNDYEAERQIAIGATVASRIGYAFAAVILLIGIAVFAFASESRPVPPSVTGVPPMYLQGLGTPTRAPEKPSLADDVLVERTAIRLTDIRVHDGDTFWAKFAIPQLQQSNGPYRIRVAGYDAWEIDGNRFGNANTTDEERRLGAKARDALDSLFGNAKYYLLVYADSSDEPHGRPVGYLRLVQEDGSIVDVAKRMIAGGHDRSLDENGKPR